MIGLIPSFECVVLGHLLDAAHNLLLALDLIRRGRLSLPPLLRRLFGLNRFLKTWRTESRYVQLILNK